MQRLAKIDRSAVQFLQSVSIDKNSGQPLINGQPLTPEQRKRLAQLIVSVMIAMYAVVHRGTQKAAQIVQDRNNLVREAQDDDNLPRFAAAINDLFRHKVRGRRLEEDKV